LLSPIYSQGRTPDPTVHLKFFTLDANRTRVVLEGEWRNNDFLFFGYVRDLAQESWGHFTLSELLGTRGPTGVPVERDRDFKPGPLSEVLARYRAERGQA
jgi:hypothetical protein